MKPCPIENCGRKFQNDQTMLEHVRRRHNDQFQSIKNQLTKSIIQLQHDQQKQLKKLPKLAQIMSKQKDQADKKQTISYRGIVGRRSQSKGKQRKVTNVSGIIQQSRQQVANENKLVNKTMKSSLNKKVSASNLMQDKLPSLQSHKIKKKRLQVEQYEGINTTKTQHKQENFYKTAPNFLKDINQSKKRLLLRSKSKGKPDEKSKQKFVEKQKFMNSTQEGFTKKMSIEIDQKISNQNKSLYRPVRKNLKKTQSKQDPKIEEKKADNVDNQIIMTKDPILEKLLSIRQQNLINFQCPKLSTVQILYLNDCNLKQVQLNNLSSLIQISLVRNKLQSMEFLKYDQNNNITKIFIDHNMISQVYIPSKVKILTASFNKINEEHFQNLIENIQKTKNLEEIDLSFNHVRKSPNYKTRILEASGTNKKMKMIDGLKVTKMDWQITAQYSKLINEQKGLIPLKSQAFETSSTEKQRPSTAISTNIGSSRVQSDGQTVDSLQNQCKQFEKLIKQINKQYKMIKNENEILEEQFNDLNEQINQQKTNFQGIQLLQKLKLQCNSLQALCFLKFADEAELVEMIERKKSEI